MSEPVPTTPPESSGFSSAYSAWSAVVMALAFAGGFTIMSIELLAGRMLAPFFGNSIYVWGSIITVFMLSLSIGYLLGGWLSLRNPSMQRFGTMFLVAALATTPLLIFGDTIMDMIFMRFEDPRYGSLLASIIMFFVPTVALGVISPYAVRLLVKHRDHSGHKAGLLYFVSTLGSALGTLLTSFYFVLWFEMQHILIALFFGLVACAVVAWAAALMFRRSGARLIGGEAA